MVVGKSSGWALEGGSRSTPRKATEPSVGHPGRAVNYYTRVKYHGLRKFRIFSLDTGPQLGYNDAMVSVTLKLRVTPELRRRIKKQAKLRERTVSVHVREYILVGLRFDETHEPSQDGHR